MKKRIKLLKEIAELLASLFVQVGKDCWWDFLRVGFNVRRPLPPPPPVVVPDDAVLNQLDKDDREMDGVLTSSFPRDRNSHIAKELRNMWNDKNDEFPVLVEVRKNLKSLSDEVCVKMTHRTHSASVKIALDEIDWTEIGGVLKKMKEKLQVESPSGLEVESEDKEVSTEGSGE